MPRCLMAKKWKAYPWPDRADDPQIESEEEIDVVGDSPATASAEKPSCWGPSSPTAGATAPSPPPHSPEASRGNTVLYNGYIQEVSSSSTTTTIHFPLTYASRNSTTEDTVETSTSPLSHQPSYVTLHTAAERRELKAVPSPPPPPPPRKSLAMCFTSTGAALSLPPKKKDIYRPYSLDDRPRIPPPAEEDLHAAHAILDLSASTAAYIGFPVAQPVSVIELSPSHQVIQQHRPEPQQLQEQPEELQVQLHQPQEVIVPEPHERLQPSPVCNSPPSPDSQVTYKNGKTVAYTYEAFFVSDGRSKRKINSDSKVVPKTVPSIPDSKPKYTCTECGKQYATSSNLSRHKQTHRSLDSQSAKKCMTCGKAYVSMPALAMHVLTHKLAHSCGVCGKLFSRPWLLQGHLRSHTGEKPYGCAHCGKAFADRSNLRAHMQTHSADKNFECARCHKSFALKSYLNKHLESACLKDDMPATGEVIVAPPPPAKIVTSTPTAVIVTQSQSQIIYNA